MSPSSPSSESSQSSSTWSNFPASSSQLPSYNTFRRNHLITSFSVSLCIVVIVLVLLPVIFPHSLQYQPLSLAIGFVTSLAARALTIPQNICLHTLIHPALQQFLRAFSISLVLYVSPKNPFSQAYYLATGWSLVNLVYENALLLSQLHLYQDILPVTTPPNPFLSSPSPYEHYNDNEYDYHNNHNHHNHNHRNNNHNTTYPQLASSISVDSETSPLMSPSNSTSNNMHLPHRTNRNNLYHSLSYPYFLDLAIRERDREALDSYLGLPLPYIPVFLFAIWRIDTTLLSYLLTLFLALSITTDQSPLVDPNSFPIPLALVLSIVFHTALSYLWAFSLPKFGIPTISYGTLLTILLLLLATLEAWGVLF